MDYRHYSAEDLQPHGILPDGEPHLIPPFQDRSMWEVAKAFEYISPKGWKIWVPEALLTDLASIPKRFRAYFGANKKETVGAVVHDRGYQDPEHPYQNVLTLEFRPLTRKEWDTEIFNNLMKLAWTPERRRRQIHNGVRLGGWWTWRKRLGRWPFNWRKNK
ncbi:MAG: DUF1353 domain-containing protein [Planctomycetota bacterium]